jgi:hypothetical protein
MHLEIEINYKSFLYIYYIYADRDLRKFEVREQLSIRGRCVYFTDSPISLPKLEIKIRHYSIHRDFVPWLLVGTFVQV